MSDKNLRIYHGKKVSKGRRQIRKSRYAIQPKDVLIWQSKRYTAKGVQNKGAYVCLDTGKVVSIKAVQLVAHVGSWATIPS